MLWIFGQPSSCMYSVVSKAPQTLELLRTDPCPVRALSLITFALPSVI